MKAPLLNELTNLLNAESRENVSNTPDFILAEYMLACLRAFESATKMRAEWYKPTPEGPLTKAEGK